MHTHTGLLQGLWHKLQCFLLKVPLNCVFLYVIYTEEYMLISTDARGHVCIVRVQHCHQHIHATLSSKWPHPYYANQRVSSDRLF